VGIGIKLKLADLGVDPKHGSECSRILARATTTTSTADIAAAVAGTTSTTAPTTTTTTVAAAAAAIAASNATATTAGDSALEVAADRSLDSISQILNKDVSIHVDAGAAAGSQQQPKLVPSQQSVSPADPGPGPHWPPVRWLAAECLADAECSYPSDVWALAVTFWEIFGYGQTPYPTLPTGEVRSFVAGGGRLAKLPAMPASIFAACLDCWAADGAARPPIQMLVLILNRLRWDDPEDVQNGYIVHTAADTRSGGSGGGGSGGDSGGDRVGGNSSDGADVVASVTSVASVDGDAATVAARIAARARSSRRPTGPPRTMERRPSVLPNKSAVIIPDFEQSAPTATVGITGGLAHYGERTTAADSQARALQTPRMSVAERTGRGQPILFPLSHSGFGDSVSTNAGAIASDTGGVGVSVGGGGGGGVGVGGGGVDACVDVGASAIVGMQ
jgi:hypothetical protein